MINIFAYKRLFFIKKKIEGRSPQPANNDLFAYIDGTDGKSVVALLVADVVIEPIAVGTRCVV